MYKSSIEFKFCQVYQFILESYENCQKSVKFLLEKCFLSNIAQETNTLQNNHETILSKLLIVDILKFFKFFIIINYLVNFSISNVFYGNDQLIFYSTTINQTEWMIRKK